MASFSWTFDAPTGAYKDHALSNEEYMQMIEDTTFVPFAATVDGYGRKMGESVTLLRIANISEPTSAVLAEGQRIPEDNFSISTKQITVQELGRAVQWNSLSDDLGRIDVPARIQTELMKQLSLVLDTLAATAFKSAQVKYIPTGPAAGTFDTDGTASSTAASNWNVFHGEEVYSYMYDTLRVPPIDGDGNYVGIFRWKSIQGLRRDPTFEEWHKYTDPRIKFGTEVGVMDNIRYVKTNHTNALDLLGASDELGEGVVFGEDAVALAQVMSPRLRIRQPEDFGRSLGAAWVGILKFDIIWDTANAGEARIVHVASDT